MVGVESEVGRVVRNLVANAVRHGQSKVVMSLTTVDANGSGPVVRLRVDDDGPGVPEEQREIVFERFARLEHSRQRDVGGSGLGLALTKRIVEAHHGSITVEQAAIGGASFVVELPAAPDE